MLRPKLRIIFIFLQLLCNFTGHGRNYCSSVNCKTNRQLCKFQQSQNPARHCMKFEKLIKSENDKKAILDKINSRRNKVAAGEIRSFPSSANMMKLEWNTTLELSAQKWANQCVKHSAPDIKDACRDLDDIEVGQNIASIYGESPGLLVTALVDIWYMELLNVNGSILPKFHNLDEGGPLYTDFTQLVWATTSEVGCGSAKFQERLQDQVGGKNRTVYRLVCNFAPSGNRAEHPVYTLGAPCSSCPAGTACDTVYTALCSESETSTVLGNSTNKTEILTSPESFSKDIDNVTKVDNILENIQNASTKESDEENYTPYDFFSHLHDFTTQSITLRTTDKLQCKDVLAVDEFIDILRKKLSKDHIFKEMFLTTKLSQGIPDGTFSDPSVAAFVKRIYSKIEPSTTTKSTENDILNSTLLVDLVEAVIFRSGGKGTVSETVELNTPVISDVSPVKVQAELAQIQQNEDFTGHYFFPEDDEEKTTAEIIEPTESYYDAPNLSIADVIMEIEDIKKNTVTRNFLDEILEMESSTERTTTTIMVLSPDDLNARKTGHEVMKKFLEDIREQSRARELYN